MSKIDFNNIIDSFSSNTIIKGMPELAYVFNNEGQIVAWNNNVEKILGYTADELYLKYVADFISPQDKERALQTMSKIFELKNEQTIEYDLITKSGKTITHLGSGSWALNNNKEYFIGMAINITKLKDTESKLLKQIEETDKLRSLLQAENIYLKNEVNYNKIQNEIIGNTKSFIESYKKIQQIAPLNTVVLLEGETGTGKELFARYIHNNSNRRNKPFIKIHCSAFSDILLESELFGHEKGAFIGALQKQIGKLEVAEGGTILLSEIENTSIELQAKILRLIEFKKYIRIGSSTQINSNVRFIFTSNKKLRKRVEQNLFREDLYYRINIYPISLKPLRERKSDMPLLVDFFIKKYNLLIEKKIKFISQKDIKLLQKHSWPGNIRELENIIERAVIITKGKRLVLEPFNIEEISNNSVLSPLVNIEKDYIIKILKLTFWQVSGENGAAKILDIHPETLRSKMRKLNIKRPKLNT